MSRDDGVVEISATVDEDRGSEPRSGRRGWRKIRDLVAVDELEAAERVPALGSIVLHYDFYGRLAQIE